MIAAKDSAYGVAILRANFFNSPVAVLHADYQVLAKAFHQPD